MSHDHTITVPEKSPRRVGVVESDGRDKTRKVVVAFVARHPKYGKFTKRRTVLQVHDEKNESRVGDRVEVAECRPISRTKSWVLLRVVEKAPVKLLAITEETGR
ncbi:MAG: 30S ribosomal protein S17 [Planctomycetota bacterium]